MKASLTQARVDTSEWQGTGDNSFRIFDTDRRSPVGFYLSISRKGRKHFGLLRKGRLAGKWKTTDLELARAAARKLYDSLELGVEMPESGPLTLRQPLDAWLGTRSVKPGTERDYRYFARVLVEWFGDDCRFRGLDEHDIQRELEKHADVPASANRTLLVLRMALEYARNKGWCRGNAAKLVNYLPRQTRRDKIDLATAREILEALPGKDQRADVVRMILYMGLRPSEVVSLEWKQVDLATGRVEWDNHKTQRKTGKKVLYLTDEALRLVARRRVQTQETRVFSRVSGNSVRTWWAGFRDKHGFSCVGGDAITFQHLRRSFATWMFDEGTDIRIVSAALGHTNTTTTLQTYVDMTDERRLSATDQANKVLGSLLGG